MLEEDELIPSVLKSDESSKERRKNWANLSTKIYEMDQLMWQKCSVRGGGQTFTIHKCAVPPETYLLPAFPQFLKAYLQRVIFSHLD
jgi:hypothetical protein